MFLALRELRRAKLRFGLLTGAVGLLVFLVLFQNSLLGGLITQFIGALRNQSAPVLVYDDQARTNVEGSQIAETTGQAIAALDSVGATGRLGQGTFTVTAGGEVTDAAIFGYDLGGLGAPTTLIEGRLPTSEGEAVASAGDADAGFDIGDRVRVEPDGVEIEVVGLADEINFSVSPTLFVSFDTYVEARLTRNPDATAVNPSLILVAPADGFTDAQVVADIAANVDGVEPFTRQEAVDGTPGVAQVRSSFAIVLGLNVMVIPIVIGLFFLIVTFQKATALTLLRALGAEAGVLVRALLVQVGVVVIGGIVLGSALVAAIAPATGGTGNVGVTFSPSASAMYGSIILATAVLASLFAVRRITAIEPIKATTGGGAIR